MRDLNVDFVELYKSIDRFINDAYSSTEGVKEYQRLMEELSYKGSNRVNGWKNDYNNLQHARWIRNQLSHEVSYDSDICTQSDYEWLESFHNRLFSADDPLSVLRKLEAAAKNEQVRRRQASPTPPHSAQVYSRQANPIPIQPQEPVYTQYDGSENNTGDKLAAGCILTIILVAMAAVLMLIVILLLIMFRVN